MKWNWIILDNPSSEEIKHRRSKELYSWLVTLQLPSWCVLRRQDKLGLKKRKSVLQWGSPGSICCSCMSRKKSHLVSSLFPTHPHAGCHLNSLTAECDISHQCQQTDMERAHCHTFSWHFFLSPSSICLVSSAVWLRKPVLGALASSFFWLECRALARVPLCIAGYKSAALMSALEKNHVGYNSPATVRKHLWEATVWCGKMKKTLTYWLLSGM